MCTIYRGCVLAAVAHGLYPTCGPLLQSSPLFLPIMFVSTQTSPASTEHGWNVEAGAVTAIPDSACDSTRGDTAVSEVSSEQLSILRRSKYTASVFFYEGNCVKLHRPQQARQLVRQRKTERIWLFKKKKKKRKKHTLCSDYQLYHSKTDKIKESSKTITKTATCFWFLSTTEMAV